MNIIQKINKKVLQKTRNVLLGREKQQPSIQELFGDPRSLFFRQALNYANYEKIPGDILEFGVFTGKTLAIWEHLNQTQTEWKFMERNVVGFDWFQGLRGITEEHERWTDESCSTNHEMGNPVAPKGVIVTPGLVVDLFKYYGLKSPMLEVGRYEEVLPKVVGGKYKKASILHIDCDLYESTKIVLKMVEPIL
jgi:hypothetical protein